MSFAYRAARAYAAVGLETNVSTAEPSKLIVMLYEGALVSVARARRHMLERDILKKSEAISSAVRIIDEGLKASLDIRYGGDLSRQLWQLYEYMCRRLLLASLHSEVSGLDEVSRLLADLKVAWEQVDVAVRAAGDSNVVALPLRS